MIRSQRTWRLAAVGAAFGALAIATPVLAGSGGCPNCTTAAKLGPPWISIEVPPNPFDQASRGAYLIVHTYHHGEAVSAHIAGTAQGLVGGARRTLPLEFTPTLRPGTYALRQQWPREGSWVLVISSSEHPGDSVTALVAIGTGGAVTRVEVPTVERGGALLPRPVSATDVERFLRAAE